MDNLDNSNEYSDAILNLKLSEDCMSVGNWEWNIQSGETIFDERWASMIGYTLEELTPTSINTWIKFTHESDLEKSKIELERHFSNEINVYEAEARMKHKNGTWVWILDRGKITEYDALGKPLKMIGTHYDITTRKFLELVGKKSVFHGLVENAPFPILISNLKDGTLRYVNKRLKEKFGIIGDEGIGLKTFNFSVNQSEQIEFLIIFKNVGFVYDYEAELYNFKKEKFWALVSATLTDYEGEPSVLISINDITERKIQEKRIEFLYLNDTNTGLFNKTALRLFEENLKSNHDIPSNLAVIYIDLDNFKKINDELGHRFGDLVISQIAHKLKEFTGDKGFIYHFESDEFVVILKNSVLSEIEEYLHFIKRMISQQILINGQIYILTASIGFEIINKFQFDNDILKNSKIAMDSAKKSKNSIKQFTHDMLTSINRSSILERDLRYSIDNKELELYYQPIYNLKTGIIDQAEALLRWNHPELGLISPLEFIPIAEQTKLILPITDWVIHETCTVLSKWNEDILGPLSISINLSFITLFNRNDELFNFIKNEIKSSGIKSKRLKIEITESSLVQDTVDVIKMFLRFKELGISLSLDDFGTGYSSFAYLKSLPLDIVKIDRTLIQSIEWDQRSMKIVESMITILHGLDFDVTIEGVETKQQFEILKNLAPDSIQGYLFSKPIKLIDFKLYYHASKDENFLPVNNKIITDFNIDEFWKSEWNSGNRVIDYQHKELFILSKKMEVFSKENENEFEIIKSNMDLIIQKIQTHFNDETQILVKNGYPQAIHHDEIHKDLIKNLLIIYRDYKNKKIDYLKFISYIEKEVIKKHFQDEDLHFISYVSELTSTFPINYIGSKNNEYQQIVSNSLSNYIFYDITLHSLLLKISMMFIRENKDNYNEIINNALELSGKEVKADRVYIFKYDWVKSDCSNTFEWCAKDIIPQIDELQNIPINSIPEWANAHIIGETIYIPNVQLLDEKSNVRQILEPQGIQSLLALPMMIDNVCYGFIGFDSVKKIHSYSDHELNILRDLGMILVSALNRNKI